MKMLPFLSALNQSIFIIFTIKNDNYADKMA